MVRVSSHAQSDSSSQVTATDAFDATMTATLVLMQQIASLATLLLILDRLRILPSDACPLKDISTTTQQLLPNVLMPA